MINSKAQIKIKFNKRCFFMKLKAIINYFCNGGLLMTVENFVLAMSYMFLASYYTLLVISLLMH